MRVRKDQFEWTLYTEWDGTWTLHAWDRSHPDGYQWLYTVRDASNNGPEEHSSVEYDAF